MSIIADGPAPDRPATESQSGAQPESQIAALAAGSPACDPLAPARRIVLVTGLSGAGKTSVLRCLEDMGYEVVDNPPLALLEALLADSGPFLAIGIDVRSRGFEARQVLERLHWLRDLPGYTVQLLYATAENDVLLRRFTATRRRHPLALGGGVLPALEQEAALLAPLRAAADMVIDTSDLPLPELRHVMAVRFGGGSGQGLSVVLMSFAYPAGLPREADIVFDVRFLRNPHYDDALRLRTGLEDEVADYVREDPFYKPFYDHLAGLVEIVLPRFVAEGKKYVTIAIGCSGGRHRSVTVVEALSAELSRKSGDGCFSGSVMVMHRELARQGGVPWRWAVAP